MLHEVFQHFHLQYWYKLVSDEQHNLIKIVQVNLIVVFSKITDCYFKKL